MDLEVAKSHLSQDIQFRMIMSVVDIEPFKMGRLVYPDLLKSIISQQLSTKVAEVIHNRFLQLFPENAPLPILVLAQPNEMLRSIGLSNQKARYLQNVAKFALENELETWKWEDMTDQEIIDHLSRIKGVGKWTVQMILMFTLGRPDVFPLDDLGIQQAMVQLYELDETGKSLRYKIESLSNPWQPYRTTAARYLWKWKDTKDKK